MAIISDKYLEICCKIVYNSPVIRLKSSYAYCNSCASKALYEMARDEARHGKALEGLLTRYFK